MWCVWMDHCDEAYGEGCAARSAERSWVREARENAEMAAMGEQAVSPQRTLINFRYAENF